MLDILFSDSACGSLKIAQRFGEGAYQNGAIGVLIAHADGSKPSKKERNAVRKKALDDARRAWENAVPMGGSIADIFGFHLILSVGDIQNCGTAESRLPVLERLYCTYPGKTGIDAAKALCNAAAENLSLLQTRLAAGETLRIWYSDAPDELCGLYWLAWQLQQWDFPKINVCTVKLPAWQERDNVIVQKTSWAEVAPEEWQPNLKLQSPASPLFLQSYASRWEALMQENAPLRAVLNGRLISAPEDLYDYYILQEIAAQEDEFLEAVVIGRVLGNHQLGIGDAWIALRIESFIQRGYLMPVSKAPEDMPRYHRRLKKC